jgi:hypothetical protein
MLKLAVMEVSVLVCFAASWSACRADSALAELLVPGAGAPPPEEHAASTVAAPASAARRGKEPVMRESTGTSALARILRASQASPMEHVPPGSTVCFPSNQRQATVIISDNDQPGPLVSSMRAGDDNVWLFAR